MLNNMYFSFTWICAGLTLLPCGLGLTCWSGRNGFISATFKLFQSDLIQDCDSITQINHSLGFNSRCMRYKPYLDYYNYAQII